jgi:hypothetical protein
LASGTPLKKEAPLPSASPRRGEKERRQKNEKNYGAHTIELFRMSARASFDYAQDDIIATKALVLPLPVPTGDE